MLPRMPRCWCCALRPPRGGPPGLRDAAALFRVRKIVFGAYDPKGGGVEHGPRVFQAPGCLHVPEVIGGVRETESAALLKAFFVVRR